MAVGKSNPIGVIVVGCCLVLSSSGCHRYVRHGVILRGDWSLEWNRVPWLKSRSTTQVDSAQSCGPEGPGCPPPGCGDGFSDEYGNGLPDEVTAGPDDPEPASYETRGSPNGCGTCGAMALRGRRRLCGRCVRLRGHPEADVGYYNHPRFHPVPTGPVFAPRGVESPVFRGLAIPREDAAETSEAAPSAPVPEQILTPPAEPDNGDRTTHAPRRLGAAMRSSSWIFNPTAARRLDPSTAAAPRATGRYLRW